MERSKSVKVIGTLNVEGHAHHVNGGSMHKPQRVQNCKLTQHSGEDPKHI